MKIIIKRIICFFLGHNPILSDSFPFDDGAEVVKCERCNLVLSMFPRKIDKCRGHQIIVILISLLLTSISFAQELRYNKDGSVDLHFPTTAEWENHKQKILLQDKQLTVLDSAVNYSYKPTITRQGLLIDTLSYQITLLKKITRIDSLENSSLLNELGKTSKPLFEFEGFYAGVRTGYLFGDTITTKESFVNSLSNNLFLISRAFINVKDFKFIPSLEIPLNTKLRTSFNIELLYHF